MTICSLVVQTKPEHLSPVTSHLNQLEGVEVQLSEPNGKLVVTIEHENQEYCSKVMTDMTVINGVMSTALIYEYQEELDV